jgi:hypothetical protein
MIEAAQFSRTSLWEIVARHISLDEKSAGRANLGLP